MVIPILVLLFAAGGVLINMPAGVLRYAARTRVAPEAGERGEIRLPGGRDVAILLLVLGRLRRDFRAARPRHGGIATRLR